LTDEFGGRNYKRHAQTKMRLLGDRNWKNLALNREEWRKLLKKARVHTGLSNQ
jgi:hypothetical protein